MSENTDDGSARPPSAPPGTRRPRRGARVHAPVLRWSAVGLVAAGGLVGVAGREGLSLAVPEVDGVPVVIPLVNVVGAFLLGYLYEALARGAAGPDQDRVARLKLLLGTGFCGGFTTYSSLATDTAVLLDRARVDLAALYALGTVVVGAAATVAGIAFAVRMHDRRSPQGAPS